MRPDHASCRLRYQGSLRPDVGNGVSGFVAGGQYVITSVWRERSFAFCKTRLCRADNRQRRLTFCSPPKSPHAISTSIPASVTYHRTTSFSTATLPVTHVYWSSLGIRKSDMRTSLNTSTPHVFYLSAPYTALIHTIFLGVPRFFAELRSQPSTTT